ncbi:MAG: branched-chain amino acid ABC transporter substrate-binding protein [Hydrogenophaga sp.]|uniref:branched-chain amino acid ABC transporter substrate-binding protein n=1 Tax=Hydrogenophaga sp. TaxID=1904254 RepID=UPI002615B2C9|nr:branched-chain amino acid ABC transporter substrate-binding protein [Hydrogenophaga sp.]MCV0437475.1 branched-chain amino acid ABC transporter substrate-binding protein [Hydrogenophaga sp.]
MKTTIKAVSAALVLAVSPQVFAQKGETVKIAMFLPLSGTFAGIGQNYLRSWQFVANHMSGEKNPAGVKFEIVGFDNKGSPQDTLNAFRAALDQGFRYVMQANGSGAAIALSEAVARHNERNPGREVLNVNSDAQDPSLTNDKCSFWYYRLDPDTSMKMEALTDFMKDHAKVQSVYLINQDYAHGHQVSAYFKEAIGKKRPDLKVVGDDLHPIAQVKDFAPYVQKIRQSGADAIVTGSWGTDLTLLVKAINDAGLKLPLYTYYANVTGTPTALATSEDAQVYLVTYAHPYHSGELGTLISSFKKTFNDDYYNVASYTGTLLLGEAIAKAKSTDPVKVAAALEGLTVKTFSGEVTMRKTDHQLQQPMFITKWQKVDSKHAYSVENTGYTFVPIKEIDAATASASTSCQMKRPSGIN